MGDFPDGSDDQCSPGTCFDACCPASVGAHDLTGRVDGGPGVERHRVLVVADRFPVFAQVAVVQHPARSQRRWCWCGRENRRTPRNCPAAPRMHIGPCNRSRRSGQAGQPCSLRETLEFGRRREKRKQSFPTETSPQKTMELPKRANEDIMGVDQNVIPFGGTNFSVLAGVGFA